MAGTSQVIVGGETIIDLTKDSVTPETLAEGATAHGANGELINGTMPVTTVLYTEQALNDSQKAQARSNIGAMSEGEVRALVKEILATLDVRVIGTVDDNGNLTLTNVRNIPV